MKKVIIGFGIVFGLLIIGLIILPFVIDVDQYRPQLVQLANSKINGHFDLGRLKLSLWGELAVEADKALLSDLNQSEILSVDKFKLTIPLKTLVSLKPEIKVVMKEPRVKITKSKQGAWNVLTLLKKEEPQLGKASKTEESTEPKKTSASNETKSAPTKSVPSWAAKAGVSIAIEEAKLKIEDLTSQSIYELNHLNLTTGSLSLESIPVFKLTGVFESKGPFEIKGQSRDSALDLEANLDKMLFSFGVLEKKAGSPTRLRATLTKKDDKIVCEGKLEPVKIRGEELKQDLEVSAHWRATSEKLDSVVLKLQAKAFDLGLTAKVDSFSNPRILATIDSKEMDLDELFHWDKFKASPHPNSQNPSQRPKPLSTKASSPVETPAVSSSKNGGVTGEILVHVGSLKLYKIRLESIHGKLNLRDQRLLGGFEDVKILGGKIKSTFDVNLASEIPKYEFQAQVEGLNLQEAVASQMELFKNTVTGTLSGEMSGRGEGSDATAAKKNLAASGKIRVTPAKLMTVDINRVLTESLKDVVGKISEKVPMLKGKDLKPPTVSSEFQKVTATFSIKDGEFNSSDFFAEAIPQKGVDIRGNTKVGLLDYALKADWEVSDTYNLLRVDPLLIERGKPFRIPIRVGGTLLSPQYDYLEIPEALAKVALTNVGSSLKEKAQQELKKQAEDKVKSILKGIFK